MAINPSTNSTMAGRVNAPDANYPYGSSKDESSPGAGDGTPYFKARADDIFGFQQWLLDRASIVPNGNADNVQTSQYGQALLQIIADASGAGADPNQWPDTANAADADHDVVINPGKILDSTAVVTIDLQAAIIKQLDAVWAEGNNLGGRASAVALTADTTYHLFLIAKDDGTVDAGWDTDLTASNLLTDAAGYTKYRRVFSNMTDASANIYAYKQVGDWVEWADYDLDYSQASTGTARVLVTAKAPQGLQTIARICSEMVSAATDIVAAWVASTDRDDVAASGVNRTLFVKSGSSIAQNVQEIHTDTSAQIAFRADASVATTVINIRTLGYVDTRAKQ